MPIYEYRCEKCGVFEETQRITDPALERCPTCRRKVRRLISNTSFQLKGSGGDVTDYARAGKGASKGGDGKDKDTAADSSKDSSETSADSTSAKTKAKAKAESKADSKPATASA